MILLAICVLSMRWMPVAAAFEGHEMLVGDLSKACATGFSSMFLVVLAEWTPEVWTSTAIGTPFSANHDNQGHNAPASQR